LNDVSEQYPRGSTAWLMSSSRPSVSGTAADQGLTLVHFSAQPKPLWSHLPVSPCVIDWGGVMHPTYPTKCAYVELKSGRVQAPAATPPPPVGTRVGVAGVHAGTASSAAAAAASQGLTLVHFSAQPEPCPTQNVPLRPLIPPHSPKHPVNSP
jgi:hypothetical protein